MKNHHTDPVRLPSNSEFGRFAKWHFGQTTLANETKKINSVRYHGEILRAVCFLGLIML